MKAVREHNSYIISKNLSFNEEIICKIIRDADKLDILETQGNAIKSDNIFHKEIIKNIYKKQCCLTNTFENEADQIIRQICYIYDINFQYSLKYIQDKNILNKKLELIKNNTPKGVNIVDIEKNLNEYLDNIIN